MMCTTRKVAIVTGASGGIGAGLVAGYRRRDWAVVASARTIKPSLDPSVLAVAADITEPATAGQIIDAALERFGRIDTLVNNAGAIIAKPFTDGVLFVGSALYITGEILPIDGGHSAEDERV